MDTKFSLERACFRLEQKYHVPDDFKRRIREILEPLFRHDLSADEMVVIERALERTYVRHAEPEPVEAPEAESPVESTASGVAEEILGMRPEPVQAAPPAEAKTEAAKPAEVSMAASGGAEPPKAVPTGVPSGKGGKGGVLLVKIDPNTKTAQLIRLSAEEVKVLANKAAISEFLKESDEEDTIVH